MPRKPLILLGLLILVSGCTPRQSAWPNTNQKRVVVTFAPLYSFTRNVGGKDVAVHCLLTGTGPHDYEPSPADALQLRGADLFFINGLNLDEFAEKIVDASKDKKVKIVEVAEELPENLKHK